MLKEAILFLKKWVALLLSGFNVLKGKIRMLEGLNQYGFIETSNGDFHFSLEELLIDKKYLKKGLKVSFKALTENGAPKNSKTQCPTAYQVVTV